MIPAKPPSSSMNHKQTEICQISKYKREVSWFHWLLSYTRTLPHKNTHTSVNVGSQSTWEMEKIQNVFKNNEFVLLKNYSNELFSTFSVPLQVFFKVSYLLNSGTNWKKPHLFFQKSKHIYHFLKSKRGLKYFLPVFKARKDWNASAPARPLC